MNKYVIANLKTSIDSDSSIQYANIISNVNYENLVICPPKEYIKLFNSDSYKLGSQDYYDDVNCEYVIIGHKDNDDSYVEIKSKIKKALDKKMKVVLCIGNDYKDDYDLIMKKLNLYLINIKKLSNIIIAYEPNFMVGSNNKVDLKFIESYYNFIKSHFSNIPVIYGGNVNKNNIKNILKIYDGVLIGRLSFNPHKFTKVLNKIIKNI